MPYTRSLENIQSGRPGLQHKARKIRSLVERAKRDPNFRAKAADLVRHIAEKDHQGEIHTLVQFVRDHVRYVRDPWAPGGLELFTDPRTLLRDALRGRASGDCDDHVILASALLETLGYETRYPVGASGPESYQHIWLEVLHPFSGWITVDLTTKDQEIGWDPGGAYHHVETYTGRDDEMNGLGSYHAPRALPPSFHNRYANPGIYVGSTPSDFFRAVAMRGQVPGGNALALLGQGHDPSNLDGWFSDVADKLKGYTQTYGPTAAGLATTIFAGPAAGAGVYGLTTALTAEAPEAEYSAPPPPPQAKLIGDAGVSRMGGAALRAMGITDAQINQAVLAAKGIDQYQAPIGPAPAPPASNGRPAPSVSSPSGGLSPGRVETSAWEGFGPGPGGGGFNPLWLAAGLGLLLLLRR